MLLAIGPAITGIGFLGDSAGRAAELFLVAFDELLPDGFLSRVCRVGLNASGFFT
jgi:hypothetical protein